MQIEALTFVLIALVALLWRRTLRSQDPTRSALAGVAGILGVLSLLQDGSRRLRLHGRAAVAFLAAAMAICQRASTRMLRPFVL